jgi:O-antigen/teichoic acid export membrane protein
VRVRRSLLNFATAGLLMAVTMVVSLKATPYLTRWLGDDRYGAVVVINQAYGYLSLLELGLGGALAPMLAGAVSGRDDRSLHTTLSAGARAYAKVMLLMIAVGLALTPVIGWFASDLNTEGLVDLRWAWVVGLASLMTLPLLPMRSVVEVRQLGYVVNLMLAAQSVLITSVALVLAASGWGITGQAAAQVVGSWVFTLTLTAGVCRGQPGLVRAVMTTPTEPETRRSLLSLSWPMLVLNVGSRVGVLSDYLIVGAVRGTEAVTSFKLTQTLATMGQSILQAIGNATWAALAEFHVRGEHDTFNRRLVEITRVTAVLAVAGLVPVVAYNRAFFRIWVPDSAYAGDAVIALAAVNALIMAELSTWCWCFTATGTLRHVVVPMSVAAVVNLVLSVALTYRYGLIGPLLGSSLAFVGISLWAVPLQLRRVFGTPLRELARAVGLPFAVGVIAAVGLSLFARAHEPASWPGLIAAMSTSALLMLALGFAVLLTREDRALWRQRAAGLWPRERVTEGG